jgi:hypothetical protein
MHTTLDLIYSETNHNIYTYTDRTVALSVIAGLIAAGERAYFGMIAGHDTTFATTATNSMVNATEAAVLAYADMAGARTITR